MTPLLNLQYIHCGTEFISTNKEETVKEPYIASSRHMYLAINALTVTSVGCTSLNVRLVALNTTLYLLHITIFGNLLLFLFAVMTMSVMPLIMPTSLILLLPLLLIHGSGYSQYLHCRNPHAF